MQGIVDVMLAWGRRQRSIDRTSPPMGIQIFATVVRDEVVLPERVGRSMVRIDGWLRYLRDGSQATARDLQGPRISACSISLPVASGWSA